jgi:phosphoribosylaminoimidazolecarboxamide formyltransferase / IMP cyclohydrolase
MLPAISLLRMPNPPAHPPAAHLLPVSITRALISVSDKTDLVPFARALASRGVEIISTGGTARALAEAGIPVTPIDQVTGFPEIMDGRVKTLHPMVHGGLLAVRDNPEHAAAMQRHGIRPIDLVCINLYPFEQTIARGGVRQSEAVEQIDIGGPSMIRSAAKNFQWVTVVTAPSQYDRVVGELEAHGSATTIALRSELAAAAFGRTSEYDAAIASYLARASGIAFPHVLRLGYIKAEELRYGENPHQTAALYRDPASTGQSIVAAVVGGGQLHGKQLSYNNINDAAAALEVVKALNHLGSLRTPSPVHSPGDETPAPIGACIVKHTNPCGAAMGATALQAVELAIAGDPLAAYGGILAINGPLDAAAAERLCQKDVFMEVVVAPSFDPEALEMLRQRWSQVRLLAVGPQPPLGVGGARKLEYRSIPGGMLAQDRDLRIPTPQQWTHAAGPPPSAAQLAQATFLEVVTRALTSNAVAIGGSSEVRQAGSEHSASAGAGPDHLSAGVGASLFGAGAGQMDRLSACRLAIQKAGPRARSAIAFSDAFFPFDDGPRLLIEAGVKMICHPGGSKRDQETFELCTQHGITCMVTWVRHFRH